MGDKLLTRWHGLYPAVVVWSVIIGVGVGGRRVAGVDAGGRGQMGMGWLGVGKSSMAAEMMKTMAKMVMAKMVRWFKIQGKGVRGKCKYRAGETFVWRIADMQGSHRLWNASCNACAGVGARAGAGT